MWVLLFVWVLLSICAYLLVLAYVQMRPFVHPGHSNKKIKPLSGGKKLTCTTSDGCQLVMRCYKAAYDSDRAVILVSDVGRESVSMPREIKYFLSKGYHVICTEQSRRRVTLGYKEKKDLRLILTISRRILGEGCRIGTYGVGAGAVSVLLHACMDDRVEFVIADSAWADLEGLLSKRLVAQAYPPGPVLWAANWICRLGFGFSLKDSSPQREMKRRNGLMSIPVLFIAGEQDGRIPAAMSEQLYKQKQDKKVLYLCAGGSSGKNWSGGPVQYEWQIDTFLQENLQKQTAVI